MSCSNGSKRLLHCYVMEKCTPTQTKPPPRHPIPKSTLTYRVAIVSKSKALGNPFYSIDYVLFASLEPCQRLQVKRQKGSAVLLALSF